MNQIIYNFRELKYTSREHPKFKGFAKDTPSPDCIDVQTLKKDLSVYRMIWSSKPSLKRQYVCIVCDDLNLFDNLISKNTIALMKELIDLDTSNFHSVEPHLLPIVQDSLLNGTFSGYQDLNSMLRDMRKLESLPDPMKDYHTDILSKYAWDRGIEDAIMGPIDCPLRGDLSSDYYKEVEKKEAQEREFALGPESLLEGDGDEDDETDDDEHVEVGIPMDIDINTD